jgi:hypothetical protein
MRKPFIAFFTAVVVLVSVLCVQVTRAQAPAPGGRAGAPAGRAAAAAPATVIQIMRGILYPSANVVFYAQSDDPDKVKKPADPSLATDLLASAYGGWEAVANASVALTESARLLEVPRACSNGKPAPITSATWKQGLSELREAGRAGAAAAKAKDMDKVLDAADKITTACSTCHDKYREKTPRCVG